MKKVYEAPELELIQINLVDVVLASPIEDLPTQFETEGGELSGDYGL